jgi:group I intron endonuclease
MIVYWIHTKEQNNIYKEGYIGITNSFSQRMANHKSFSSKSDYPIYNAIKKYGWNNLIKETLLISNEDYCKLIEFKLRPFKRIGWNLSEGGRSFPNLKGIKQSKEHIEKRKKALKGRISGFLGKKHNNDSKKKCGIIHKGIPKSKEIKMKISQANQQAIKINNVVYDSWLKASNILGIPMGSLNHILKGLHSKNGKYSWINSCELVM